VILPPGATVLDEVADLVGAHPDFGVFVDGHADSTGDAEYNRALSLRRAEAVVVYLVNRGVTESQLRARGFGESAPRASNATDEGRARNRRVEFRLQ
jgi:outer membrane protein OmpA-like peptidoglycan-associated protein